MNWTGGRLQRHSKANKNEALYRQKQHFAAVRQQIQSEQPLVSPGQPRWKSQGLWDRDDSFASLVNAPGGRVNETHLHQTKLDHYEMTAVVARRLATMSKRLASLAAPVEVTRVSPSISGKSKNDTRLRTLEVSPAAESSKRVSRADVALQQSRKRLLEQSDWVGLNIVRPTKTIFASHHDREHLGKRRRVHGDKKCAHVRTDRGFEKLLGPLVEESNDDEQFYMHGALQPVEDNISIRIGGDVRPSQVVVATESGPASVHCDASSSRTMLFETDAATNDVHECEANVDLLSMQQVGLDVKRLQRNASDFTRATNIGASPRSPSVSPHRGDNEIDNWQTQGSIGPNQEFDVAAAPQQLETIKDLPKDADHSMDPVERRVYEEDLSLDIADGNGLQVDAECTELFEAEPKPQCHPPTIVELQKQYGGHASLDSIYAHQSSMFFGQRHIGGPRSVPLADETLAEKANSFQQHETWQLQPAHVTHCKRGRNDRAEGSGTCQQDHADMLRCPEEHAKRIDHVSMTGSFIHNDHDEQVEYEHESNPNKVWKRFIFDDISSGVPSRPSSAAYLVEEAAKTELASSLFVCNSSATAGRTQSFAFTGNSFSRYSEGKSGRMRRRPAYRDLNSSESIPAASDAMLMFRDAPEPLVWNPADTSSADATALGASVVAASVVSYVSMSSTELDSTESPKSDFESREEQSPAPTAFNVPLTSNANHLNSTSARRKDSRRAAVKSTRPAQLHDEDEDASHVATIQISPSHAKGARARPGPKRIGAAGNTGRGKHIVKATKQSASSLPSGWLIYDLPYSESVDKNGLV